MRMKQFQIVVSANRIETRQPWQHQVLLHIKQLHTKQGSISVSKDGWFCSTALKQMSVASPYFCWHKYAYFSKHERRCSWSDRSQASFWDSECSSKLKAQQNLNIPLIHFLVLICCYCYTIHMHLFMLWSMNMTF